MNDQTSQSAKDVPSHEERGNETQPPDQSSGGSFWALMILLIAAAATLVAIQRGRPKPAGGAYVGQILPPLDAGGWINTQSPLTAEDLRGKIVLVDFWASDCLPCVHEIPNLIAFNKRYHDRGVMIVGLSDESGQRAVHLKNLIETRDGLDWPNGYDARLAYEILGITGSQRICCTTAPAAACGAAIRSMASRTP